MRKVKVILLALVTTLIFAGTVQAATYDVPPKTSLRSEIIDLIDQPTEGLLQESLVEANLRLMVNGNNELIVIDSGTDNAALDAYIKSKLNYKKVKADDIQYFTFYYLKMKFKS